jgi:leucyl-tRNA synthetase
MKRYSPKEIEPKWQKKWEQDGIYRTNEDSDRPKRYVLEYFPYPSGAAMHVGHVRNYTIGDAVARFYRMRGYNVLHPMGWDSFGLPAENFAIKNGISPQQAIEQNTTKFKQQLTQMGFSYDWSREINSSDPCYYKWTQWFFLLLLKKGLAYQKDSLQWWCETDGTVLANEQVENGKCWRCGDEVSKKPLKQWFFKITDYADGLAEDLDELDWSEAIKSMQRNWIGKSKGAEIDFKLASVVTSTEPEEEDRLARQTRNDTVRVFTTRPDTLFGATFMVLAPEHELVQKITTEEQKSEVETYVKQAQAKSDVERQETDREKTGVFTGAYVINPVNDEKIPVWIADYVLTGYGTGAIMAVPAHDERDNEFAKKYKLTVTQVVEPVYIQTAEPGAVREGKEFVERDAITAIVKHWSEDKYIGLKWKKVDWDTFITGGVEDGQTPEEAARNEVREETGYRNLKLIKQLSNTHAQFFHVPKDENRYAHFSGFYFELQDDTRDDIVDAEQQKHSVVWLTKDEMDSFRLPESHRYLWDEVSGEAELYHGEGVMVNSGQYDGMSSSEARERIVSDLAAKKVGEEVVNYKIRDWLISRQRYWGAPIPVIHCPKDGVVPVPEDQLPVVLPEVDSYKPTGEGTSVLASVHDWVNTACPKCGQPAKRETDTMDGFACSSWYFLRFADPHNDKKPFDAQKSAYWLPVDDYIGGAEHAVMHLLYARMWTKVMYDEGLIDFQEPFKALRNHGMILAPDGRKMSKSWGNVIAPDDLISQGYGADSIRIMELFIGPWNQSANWSVEGMGGSFRFLQRFWTLTQEYTDQTEEQRSKKTLDEIELKKLMHKTIFKVSDDLHNMSFNTAISALMACLNRLYKLKAEYGFEPRQQWNEAISTFTQLLAPFAPHIAEEIWATLGNDLSVHLSDWPQHDDKYLVQDKVTIVVQVNGKVRQNLRLPADLDKEEVEKAALADDKIKAQVKDKKIVKTIVVANKLINLVVK